MVAGRQSLKVSSGWSTDGKSGWKARVSGKQMWLKANMAGRKWLMEGKCSWKTKVKEGQGGCRQCSGMAGRHRLIEGKDAWKAMVA
jgi:hypothetical protein